MAVGALETIRVIVHAAEPDRLVANDLVALETLCHHARDVGRGGH